LTDPAHYFPLDGAGGGDIASFPVLTCCGFPLLYYNGSMHESLTDIGDAPGSRRARTRGIARGEIEAVLIESRTAREAAQRDEAVQLDRLAALLPAARAAGFSFEQIAELSGASRPTLNRLREPPRTGWSDAEFTALLVLALGGSQTKQQIAGCARSLELEVERDPAVAVDSLLARGLLASFHSGYEGQLHTYYRLTQAGERVLGPRLGQVGIGPAFRWGIYFGVSGKGSDALMRAGETLLGRSELTLLAPGAAGNQSAEIAFRVRAASRAEAIEQGRVKFATFCREAGLTPTDVVLTVLALEPHAELVAGSGDPDG
jgi:hypothetical protein